jgi:hypothetical protein
MYEKGFFTQLKRSIINVLVYNMQHGIIIDYVTEDISRETPTDGETAKYVGVNFLIFIG